MSSKLGHGTRLALVAAVLLGGSQAAGAAVDAGAAARGGAILADNARGVSYPVATGDALVDAIVQWDRLRRDVYPASFAEIAAFVRAHPDWPLELTLRRRAEKLIDAGVPMAERARWFATYPPLSSIGKFRFAEAQLAASKREAAVALARDAWASSGLDAPAEGELLALFGGSLTANDHLARADRLLWSGQTSAAARVLGSVPPEYRDWAAARIAFRTNSPDAAARLATIAPAQRSDPGLIFDQVQWLKRRGDIPTARAVMATATIAPGSVGDAEQWLKLRAELTRAALKDGDANTAYRLAAYHSAFALGKGLNERTLAERQAYIDAEWLAGWIALRKQNRPSAAVEHFANVRAAALTPVSQSRGDYWAGRAAAAAGRPAEAARYYAEAAKHPDYFYGQLASEQLGRPLAIVRPAATSVPGDARRRFEASEQVQATRALGLIGARDRQSIFMRSVVERAETPQAQQLVTELATSIGRPDLGVMMGKAARAEGELALIDAAFPLLPLPPGLASDFTAIHAVTRQESQFDRAIVSASNAKGLMQLLPSTAQETAAKIGIDYSLARLTDDPIYNVTLGAAYFDRIRANLAGSWPLAAAAYNAGPGNVRKFLALNGDPRGGGVDIVDWIEAIPLSETRTYVQRVMENAVMYDLLHPETARMPKVNRLSAYLGKKEPG